MCGYWIRARASCCVKHLRQKRGWHRIQEADRSPRTPLSTVQLLERAGRPVRTSAIFAKQFIKRQGQVGVRRILGRARLSQEVWAGACRSGLCRGTGVGVREYHFVRRYLERNRHCHSPCNKSTH